MDLLRPPWRVLLALAAAAATVAIVLLGTAGTHVMRGTGHRSNEHQAPSRSVRIPASGGVTLATDVTLPTGGGSHPLVVMPASWNANASEYAQIAKRLAAAGFVVVAYAQRGFPPSTGQIDAAGTRTQHDVSTVIDWALTHTPADQARIGLAGISYGAGISLLAAEHDPRIKAVAAMSTWTDFDGSFAQNDTLSVSAVGALFGSRYSSRLVAALGSLGAQAASDPAAAIATLRQVSPDRSPLTDVAAINRAGTAILLANGYEDSFFAPEQLVTFYDALTVPKRLDLAPGDHTGPERLGLEGQGPSTVDDVQAWLDHYVRGVDNGIDHKDPIELEDSTTRMWHGYAHWPADADRLVLDLGGPGTTSGVGLLASTASAWSTKITTGTDTTATSAIYNPIDSAHYNVTTARISGWAVGRGVLWNGPTLQRPTLVSGTAALHLSIASSSPSATIVAYLYDVAPSGTGRLMSVTPYTATGLSAVTPKPIGFALQPTSWTLPAGDHLSLAIDTVDPRYHSAAPTGSTITLSSFAASPATLGLPVNTG